MSAAARARWASLALLSALLTGVCALARGAPLPPVGGTVESTLELSLGEPSGFRRTGSVPEGNVYTATVRAEVTATDAPTRLSVEGGLGGDLGLPVSSWGEPVSHAPARVRLRAVAPSAGALRNRQELFVVTLTAGGP